MPELPEVETILNGIKSHLIGQKILSVEIRFPRLRWDIPQEITTLLKNETILSLTRRGKYLLIEVSNGTLIIHLGMSGRLCVLKDAPPPGKHDHVDLLFKHYILRFTDPRRFGAILWAGKEPNNHPLLKIIGPEPLSAAFNTEYLWQTTRNKKVAVKSFIMNSKMVAGVGNIYAAEALFAAQIHPLLPAGKLNKKQCHDLVGAIKKVLRHAIKKGGTTLKDYMRHDGSPGYFSIELQVYGREKEACPRCDTKLKLLTIGKRSTVYCPYCQRKT